MVSVQLITTGIYKPGAHPGRLLTMLGRSTGLLGQYIYDQVSTLVLGISRLYASIILIIIGHSKY